MLGPLSRRELIRKFKNLGFTGPVSGGRHQFMIRGALKVRIPNPHGTASIDVSLIREILGQAESRRANGKKPDRFNCLSLDQRVPFQSVNDIRV